MLPLTGMKHVKYSKMMYFGITLEIETMYTSWYYCYYLPLDYGFLLHISHSKMSFP